MAMPAQTSEAPVNADKPAGRPFTLWQTPGELSVDEWIELNAHGDGSRYELIDGSLIVSPAPPPQHQWIGDNLRQLLHTAIGDELAAITATGVLLDDSPGVIPDVIVVERQPIRDGARLISSGWVHLAVEIVSKSTTVTDRRVKPIKYAESGIPHFWRIEMLPFRGQMNRRLPVIYTYALDKETGYQLTHQVAAGETVELTDPFKLTLDPAKLAEI
ncbi:hypothetical protein Misp01_36770 [Microtetraspora sp. NBRC 13810]|uniref:Uma2 family endonuclease n=1 Tax=Microtetraspora sp. NBRC 13810 TaxID=3030990 RepID=UPI0024A3AB3C|nr:Uma2 family endonuclease [Microtetraspora sp. NBRC 13810]GLW08547.1 hypothetical protein Misp01_36770 [Microtetraspora sp. NBRC 13810]